MTSFMLIFLRFGYSLFFIIKLFSEMLFMPYFEMVLSNVSTNIRHFLPFMNFQKMLFIINAFFISEVLFMSDLPHF